MHPRGHASGAHGGKHCHHAPQCIGEDPPDDRDPLGCCHCGTRREEVKAKAAALPRSRPSPVAPPPAWVAGPRFDGGDLSPEGPSTITHPKTMRTQASFLKGGLTATVIAAVMRLGEMFFDDRQRQRDAERAQSEALLRREDERELRELRWRIVEATKQPWAAAAPVDGGRP